jgi:hypothetical protein
MSTPRASRLGKARQILFEQGVSRLIFEHARNLVVAMLVLAVGVEATKHDPSEIGILYFRPAGYLVAAIGVLLMLLNLGEGLHRLAKVRLPGAWQALLIAVYLVLFWRVARLVMLFR